MPSGKTASLLERLKNTSRNWSQSDLGFLLSDHNFESRRGRHGILFVHRVHRDLIIMIANGNSLAPDYAQDVRKLLEELEVRKESNQERTQ